MKKLLTCFEVDQRLRYSRGRSARLARQGKLPHIRLPDGEIRFDEDEISRLLTPAPVAAGGEGTVANVGR